mgnify:CR=1 FL=1
MPQVGVSTGSRRRSIALIRYRKWYLPVTLSEACAGVVDGCVVSSYEVTTVSHCNVGLLFALNSPLSISVIVLPSKERIISFVLS